MPNMERAFYWDAVYNYWPSLVFVKILKYEIFAWRSLSLDTSTLEIILSKSSIQAVMSTKIVERLNF